MSPIPRKLEYSQFHLFYQNFNLICKIAEGMFMVNGSYPFKAPLFITALTQEYSHPTPIIERKYIYPRKIFSLFYRGWLCQHWVCWRWPSRKDIRTGTDQCCQGNHSQVRLSNKYQQCLKQITTKKWNLLLQRFLNIQWKCNITNGNCFLSRFEDFIQKSHLPTFHSIASKGCFSRGQFLAIVFSYYFCKT